MAGVQHTGDDAGRASSRSCVATRPPTGATRIYYQYFEYPERHMVRRHYGVRTKRYKLIHYYEVDEWELFDLESDPQEMRSVYADIGYRDELQNMKAKLHELRVQYRVPDVDPVPYRPWPPPA